MPYKRKKKEQEDGVDSRCDAQREEVLQDIRYQDRGARLGIRNKKSSRKRLDDPFGILNALEMGNKIPGIFKSQVHGKNF